MVDAPAVIKLKGVTKSYMPRGGQPFQALCGINLDVCEGEFVAVLGKSGSGKSTLLNVIAGLDRSTIQAALEEGVSAEVLSTALYTRFRSRQEHTFAEKILSAMRKGFGGHIERPPALKMKQGL